MRLKTPDTITSSQPKFDRARYPLYNLRYAAIPVIAGLAFAACGNSSKPTANSGTNASATTETTAAAAPNYRPPSSQTYTEISDNTNGVAVFSSPEGGAVPNNVPPRIPYGTHVQVACFAPNLSGMASVNDLYLIESGPWQNMYGVADSFANGGPMGQNSDNIDPAVPKCIS